MKLTDDPQVVRDVARQVYEKMRSRYGDIERPREWLRLLPEEIECLEMDAVSALTAIQPHVDRLLAAAVAEAVARERDAIMDVLFYERDPEVAADAILALLNRETKQ